MRVRKVDSNQAELVRQIRKIPGVSVLHLHTIGEGCPDILVGVRHKGNFLCEVKDPNKPPSKRKLTPDEEEFHRNWTGQIAVIMTLDDVLKMIGNNEKSKTHSVL